MTDQQEDQPSPQVGDRVRITRTTTEVFEGYWSPADADDPTGDHGLSVDGNGYRGPKANGFWMRVRDRGPLDYGFGEPGGYLEADTIEVIEARHGAPADDRVTPLETGRSTPPLSPALIAARRRFNVVFVSYLVVAFVAGLIVTGFFLDPLRAEFGRIGTAVLLATVFAVVPAIPLSLWAHRNDRASKRETTP